MAFASSPIKFREFFRHWLHWYSCIRKINSPFKVEVLKKSIFFLWNCKIVLTLNKKKRRLQPLSSKNIKKERKLFNCSEILITSIKVGFWDRWLWLRWSNPCHVREIGALVRILAMLCYVWLFNFKVATSLALPYRLVESWEEPISRLYSRIIFLHVIRQRFFTSKGENHDNFHDACVSNSHLRRHVKNNCYLRNPFHLVVVSDVKISFAFLGIIKNRFLILNLVFL